MPNDSAYQGGGTTGGKLGCAVEAITGLPLLGAAFIYASMGHCIPEADCIDGWKMIAAAAAISGIIGVAARGTINAFLRYRQRGR
ncbi:hypothetical protein [Sphingomonas sp. Marseille-Q8236]